MGHTVHLHSLGCRSCDLGDQSLVDTVAEQVVGTEAGPVVGTVAEPADGTVAEEQHELVLGDQQGLPANDHQKLGIYKYNLTLSNFFNSVTTTVTYPFLPAT